MNIHVKHKTCYDYTSTVSFSRNILRLKPRDQKDQSLQSFSLSVDPSATIYTRTDFYDNDIHICKITEPHEKLTIKTTSEIKRNSHFTDSESSFEDLDTKKPELQEFLLPTDLVPLNQNWLNILKFPEAERDTPILQYLSNLMVRLDEQFTYNPSATNAGTDLEEFSNHKSGVCQDFAHSLLAVCRQQKLPARYVSGYLLTGEGSNASHAWLEIHTPDQGWIGLDPTNNQFTDQKYVVLSYGRDYNDCSPVEGIRRGGGEDTMSVEVNVEEGET